MGWFDFMQESIAIDLGGAYLNSGEHGAKFKIIEKKLYAFGVKAAKNVVAEDVKAEEKILKEKEKELAQLRFELAQLRMNSENKLALKTIKNNQRLHFARLLLKNVASRR